MKSKFRGHEIEERNGAFFFTDTGEPTAKTWKNRPCGYCGKHNTDKGHDACLGELPGVANACCGHGTQAESYIQFNNGVVIRSFILTDENS